MAADPLQTAPAATSTDVLAADPALYRSGLRAWLQEGHVDEWRDSHRDTALASLRENGRLVALLYERGWGRYGWPSEAGGLGGDERHLAVLFDELSRRGVPIPEQYGVLQVLGPPLVHFAPDLAAKFLGAFLRGEEWWGQGFSEPEAGSDMASLRTRAVETDGGWKLDGTKLWTSHGPGASRLVILARTGTPESRHRGLTVFLVDSDQPGVVVRPIALSNGREELAEVFLDDVRVPDSRRIGDVGQGWAVAMYLMQYERGLWAWLRSTVLQRKLGELARLVDDTSSARTAIGALYVELSSLRATAAATVTQLATGSTVGAEASADKLLLGQVETMMLDTARDLLGVEFLVGGRPEVAIWRDEWWWSRTTTIYGGSAEVQRQIIADKVLELPRESR